MSLAKISQSQRSKMEKKKLKGNIENQTNFTRYRFGGLLRGGLESHSESASRESRSYLVLLVLSSVREARDDGRDSRG